MIPWLQSLKDRKSPCKESEKKMMSTATLLKAAAGFFTGILTQVQVKSQPLFPIDQIFSYREVHEWSLFLTCASFLCCVRLIVSHFRRIKIKRVHWSCGQHNHLSADELILRLGSKALLVKCELQVFWGQPKAVKSTDERQAKKKIAFIELQSSEWSRYRCFFSAVILLNSTVQYKTCDTLEHEVQVSSI